MQKRFYPPVFDYVFKRIFGDQHNSNILAAFLMAALGLPKEDFDHLAIVDSHLNRNFSDDKESILDVRLFLKSGVVINVEAQVRIIRGLRERIAFAGAKLLSEQLRRGQDYQSLKRAEPQYTIRAEINRSSAESFLTAPRIPAGIAMTMLISASWMVVDKREASMAATGWRCLKLSPRSPRNKLPSQISIAGTGSGPGDTGKPAPPWFPR
jgi:hypothetical protein